MEGFKIEESIQNEDINPEEPMYRTLNMFSIPLMNDFDLISHDRSVMGKTRTRTLKDLLTIGLIDQNIYDEVKAKIESNELTLEVDVLSYAAGRVVYHEDFEENKSNDLEYIKLLNNEGIISNETFEILKAEKEILFNKYDLIKYSENAKIFHLKDYSTNSEDGYKEIFEEIKLLVPQFDFTNFKVNIFEAKNQYSDDLIEYKSSISFFIDGKEYLNEFFQDYKKKNESEKDSILRVSDEFHKGINKYLTDLNSEYRLFYANSFATGRDALGSDEFGMIMLTEEQFEAWGAYSSDYFMSKEDFKNNFNSNNIRKLLASYEEIGLFNHLNEAKLNKAKKSVFQSEIKSHQSILLCFPKTIVYFDWESGNLENPYEELTIEFSNASKGAFKPKKIVDSFKNSWGKESVQYSFELNGKVYQENLFMDSDWLDPKFMDLILSAIKGNNIDGEFYYCLDDGQASGFIFLTKEQYQYLKKNQPDLFPGQR